MQSISSSKRIIGLRYVSLRSLIVFHTLFLTCVAEAQVKHPHYWDAEKKALTDTSNKEIDPRRYVHVLYKKNPHYSKNEYEEMQRVIWNWDTAGYYQKFKVLDNEGFLEIYFKKDELSKNYNFQGNISLEAILKGKDGDRKIEVGPSYSLVGKDQKEIGIQSFPATTVAQLLFNTIIEMKRTIVFVDFAKYDTLYYYQSETKLFADAITKIKADHKNLKVNIDPQDNILSVVNKNLTDPFYENLWKYRNPAFYPYQQLVTDLETASGKLQAYIAPQTGGLKRDITFLLNRLTLINNYLGAFEKAGPDAVKAFLKIASKDRVNFNFLRQRLQDEQSQLVNLMNDPKIAENSSQLLASRSYLEHALEIVKTLNTFSSVEGSIMENLIKRNYVTDYVVRTKAREIKMELEEEHGNIPYNRFMDKFELYPDSTIVYNKYSRYILLRVLEKSGKFEKFKEELSQLAAEIIYGKLVMATINLGKSGAQPGDVLYLYVVWKNIDGENDSTGTSSSLPIGTFQLRETGWKTKITESFYLVERINEPAETDPEVARSNFKGAYGASIMRTFFYNENFRRTVGGSLLNFFQPSIGFNISYVDFYKSKDIEIGAGLQLGLFRNVFFFGSGINLHGIRGDEKKSAAYFMFGVSFTNIAAKFKNGDKLVE